MLPKSQSFGPPVCIIMVFQESLRKSGNLVAQYTIEKYYLLQLVMIRHRIGNKGKVFLQFFSDTIPLL